MVILSFGVSVILFALFLAGGSKAEPMEIIDNTEQNLVAFRYVCTFTE